MQISSEKLHTSSACSNSIRSVVSASCSQLRNSRLTFTFVCLPETIFAQRQFDAKLQHIYFCPLVIY
ncbi:hypothetical protein T4E_874 [Trichinella pseudospiralis]|uniref:Uncharacterized protein n=1 Tax=Trichinella pseudospiralis TaxID=6337 RepID=A0A0V0XGW2_TRIPS|nr:hypothetical protein T4E_12054 [Trichinella pseudospiralis]KRX86851.1 hypothetical protein T4E_874 [Trichinella pseudospiralis]